jgi:predicted HD superfamily hydrolase involved in NAD metabolism
LYTSEFEAKVRAWAKTLVKPKRWEHVCGVVETSERLAKRYAPESVAQVRLAAWCHDLARNWEKEELLDYAEKHGLAIRAIERETPMLLHGIVGYQLAAEQFRLDDPVIGSACQFHTTGAPNMSVTDKVVFLADFIEPSRDYPNVNDIRAEAEISLDSAVLLAIDLTLSRLIANRKVIDVQQVELRNQLIEAGVKYKSL